MRLYKALKASEREDMVNVCVMIRALLKEKERKAKWQKVAADFGTPKGDIEMSGAMWWVVKRYNGPKGADRRADLRRRVRRKYSYLLGAI